jgi:WD repeat-containing protein 40A
LFLAGSVPSVDEGWGVKSLSTFDHLVTVGGGLGRLSFFDVRKCEYLALPHHDQDSAIFRQCHGALRDSPVRAEYARRRLPTLCGLMSHAWDASRSRLLVAGGPLFADLSGIYAAVWN